MAIHKILQKYADKGEIVGSCGIFTVDIQSKDGKARITSEKNGTNSLTRYFFNGEQCSLKKAYQKLYEYVK